MRSFILVAAAAALAGCSQQKPAEPANDANVAAEPADINATPAAADPNAAKDTVFETSWEFVDPKTGKPIQESIDAKGNYVSVSGTEHIDHGTVVMKDGKACFTSAMTKDGEICWTDPKTAVGESGETTNDKGEKVTVKRVAYVPRAM